MFGWYFQVAIKRTRVFSVVAKNCKINAFLGFGFMEELKGF
jgi:hypothetical protein